MLAYLRKIRKNLIESGSAQKYFLYAIGEIALVVIGILIALQINNWNEYQKERKVELKTLQELAQNLEANIIRLKINLDRNTYDNQDTDFILSVFNERMPYTDSLDKIFPFALNPVDIGSFLTYTGYESLKNTGFDIISDDGLKQEIVSLFEESYQELEARYNRVEPTRVELGQFVRKHFYRKSMDYAFTPINFEGLSEDKNLTSWLYTIKGYRSWVSEELMASKQETESVLGQIRASLSERGINGGSED